MNHPILEWGVEVVRAVQTVGSPALTALMRGVTFLGAQYFYLAALPLLYWCVDRRRGARIGIVFFLSTYLNLVLKDAFAQPRPYDLDPSVGMARETSPGLPSNHAQGTAVFWGLLAPSLGRIKGWLLALVVTFAVGFSRIYLGVHFPTDVFAGWGLAILVLAADALLVPRFERLFGRVDLRLKLTLAAGLVLVMNAIDRSDTSITGAFLGVALGFVLAGRYARFSAKGSLGRKALRYLAGIAVTAILYLVPKLLLGEVGSGLEPLVRFVRYGILGLWVSLGAPWCFLKLKLAEREE